MTLQHRHMFPVLKADQAIGKDGFPSLDGCLRSWLRFRQSDVLERFASTVTLKPGQCPLNVADQPRQSGGRGRMGGQSGRHDPGRRAEEPIGAL
jgi:hypothetical protein